jgi:broad specificity phosphatase PhoE
MVPALLCATVSSTAGPERVTDVLAIRHGESAWNAAGRWQGQADPPLTELGRRQAAAAGEVLAQGTGFDAIVGSDLQRAGMTAAIIGEVIGTPVAFLDHRFRENHAGEWQGLTREDIQRHWPGYLEVDARPPGFERPEHTAARMYEGMVDAAHRLASRRLLVIGHSGALRQLRRAVGGDDVRIPNLGGFWFQVNGTVVTTGDVVILLDDDVSVVE